MYLCVVADNVSDSRGNEDGSVGSAHCMYLSHCYHHHINNYFCHHSHLIIIILSVFMLSLHNLSLSITNIIIIIITVEISSRLQ